MQTPGLETTEHEGVVTVLSGLARCFVTADLQEGLAAFAQKRRPRFTGR